MDDWLFGYRDKRLNNSGGVNWLPGMEWDEIGQRWSPNSRRNYPQNAFRAVSDSYFTGLAMHGGDGVAYQKAMRRARPIIAQWSEWEQQTRNPAWR